MFANGEQLLLLRDILFDFPNYFLVFKQGVVVFQEFVKHYKEISKQDDFLRLLVTALHIMRHITDVSSVLNLTLVITVF